MKNHGGKRVKSTPTKGAVALLDAIWRTHGGPSHIAKLLGFCVQRPVNWRNRGKVPLLYVPTVAQMLGIYEWGLNYEGLRKFYGSDKTPSWMTVVKAYGLPPETVRFIYGLERPDL